MSNSPAVPFETTLLVREHCLCLAAQRAARALSRRFDEAFRPLGITSGQYSLLMSLNRPQAPSIGAVAGLLAMDRTTLTANLKPLERRGLLTSTPDPDDRRSRRLALTDAGCDTLAAAVPIWRQTHADIDASLPPADIAGLRSGLATLA